MKLVILHLFVGSILLMVRIEPPRGRLSARLAALRHWPSRYKHRIAQ